MSLLDRIRDRETAAYADREAWRMRDLGQSRAVSRSQYPIF